jgi:transcriptional regulator with XRE-family HTH domain
MAALSDNIYVMSSESKRSPETIALGLKVRELRETAGITQRELAERLDAQQPAIARLENGHVRPDMVTLERIATALGCQLEVRAVPFDQAINNGVPFRFV